MDTPPGDPGSGTPRLTLSRRAALRALGAAPIGLLGVHGDRSSVHQQPSSQPNILFILLDDLRADDLAAMPIAQSHLVAEGTTCENFFATAPLCAPSRASILRGEYPHNHGVLRGSGVFGGFDLFQTQGEEQSTIATWLHDAGYRTALIGKYLNGYPDGDGLPAGVTMSFIPPGWNEWVGLMKEGYHRFSVNDNGEVNAFQTRKRQTPSAGADEADSYSTDLFAARAEKFVTDTLRTDQPFFLYLAPYAVHGPADPPQRYRQTFAGARAPRPPSFNEADISDKPRALEIPPLLSPTQIADLDERYAERLETLQAVDEMIGRLLDILQAAGALERTYIVLSSDNGYHLGEHRFAQEKGTPYEEAIRVPLVVRGPGIPAGQMVSALTSQVDLAPTFATWGDAVVPDFVDGRSLAPLFSEEVSKMTWRQSALVEHSAHGEVRGDGSPATSSFAALRTTSNLYVEYASGEQELYDLSDDPFELENLIGRGDQALIQALAARLAEMSVCTGEVCRTVEAAPLPQASANRATRRSSVVL